MHGMATHSAPALMAPSTPLRRNAAIALAVVVTHAAAIWTLQSSFVMRQGNEILVPVSLLVPPPPPAMAESQLLGQAQGPRPAPRSTPPVSKPDLKPKNTPEPRTSQRPEPAPLAAAAAHLAAPNDQAPKAEPSRATSAPAAAPDGLGPAVASPAAAAAPTLGLQLPNTHADYLRNPKPAYPPLSRRLNEQGTVVHSVLIAADGRPVNAKLVQSSGFERLDKAAYEAVMQWRYVPGKRQGIPEAMSFNVPIKWALE